MAKESRLQRGIRQALENRWPTCWAFKVHGGPYQPAGAPDIVGCVEGRFVGLEVKKPGELPSRAQENTLVRLRVAGAICGVVTSADEAVARVERGLRRNGRLSVPCGCCGNFGPCDCA